MSILRKSLVILAAAATVASCGGSGANESVSGDNSSPPVSSASATETTDSSHPAEAGEPDLITVPGYDYVNATGALLNVCKMFSQLDIETCSVHEVTNLRAGYFVVVGLSPTSRCRAMSSPT